MANNKLTLLACAGSILATTIFSTPSHGMPSPSFEDNAPRRERINMPQASQGENLLTPASYEQRLKRAAVDKFACGCQGCVGSIHALVQSGQIFL